MEVIYRSTETLKKLEDNPRTISEGQLQKLKESIQKNPDYFEARPIILSDRTGHLVIIAGNQRYDACVQLGIKEVPTVLIPNLTEEREREIIIRDNVSNGEWDEMILKDKWDVEELKDWGVDLPADWDTSEAEEQKEAEEDDFSDEDAEKAEPRVKLGEIWKLGEHRLMCGDSTDAASVALLMDGQKADMVFTDPPYGVSIGDKNKALNSVQKAGRCTENIANDNISVDDLYPILVKAMTNCRESCKDCACYCMMDASVEGDIVLDMFGGSGTTMIAAEQLGRKARLMELDPHYCDVIIARWEKLTGKEAVKVYG
jgi:16S rRNA G966 N2-methylase RsmD